MSGTKGERGNWGSVRVRSEGRMHTGGVWNMLVLAGENYGTLGRT